MAYKKTEKIMWILISEISEGILFCILLFLFSYEKYALIGETIRPILVSCWIFIGIITPFVIWFELFDEILEIFRPCKGV